MNSQNNREGIFAALNFLIVTILSLIISWVSSEKGGTPVSYWLAVGFVVLLATGALLQLARRSTDQPTAPPPPTDGTTPAPLPTSSLPRAATFVLTGALFGLIVSALFYVVIGPGTQGATAGPRTSPTVSVAPPPTPSTPVPSGPATPARLVTVNAAPGDGGTRFGDEITVTVTAARPLPAGDTYWLVVEFLGGQNLVYKAEGKIPAGPGATHYSLSIASAAVGSTRKIYVLQADTPQATEALAQNFAHPAPAWDGNRTSLPSGVVTVSNSATVVKQAG